MDTAAGGGSLPRGRSSAALLPGQVVADRFEVRTLVAEGPTGLLYRAFDEDVEIEVALKIIHPELLPDWETRGRFVKGLGKLVHVVHPNVVRCFEVGLEGERVFVAMQLCEGLPLRKLLVLKRDKGEAFALADLEPIVEQIARGLSAIHKRGLVAVALRPENIIVLPEAIKVADAALWRELPAPALKEAASSAHAERYLAPEVKKGGAVEPRADSYSLAVVIEEMLGGPEKVPAQLAEALLLARTEEVDRRPSVLELAADVTAVARTGQRTAPPTPRTYTAPPPARPAPALSFARDDTRRDVMPDGAPGSSPRAEPTVRMSEEDLELALIDQDATRQVDEDELLTLRAASSGVTQQIGMEDLLPAGGEEGSDLDDDVVEMEEVEMEEEVSEDLLLVPPSEDGTTDRIKLRAGRADGETSSPRPISPLPPADTPVPVLPAAVTSSGSLAVKPPPAPSLLPSAKPTPLPLAAPGVPLPAAGGSSPMLVQPPKLLKPMGGNGSAVHSMPQKHELLFQPPYLGGLGGPGGPGGPGGEPPTPEDARPPSSARARPTVRVSALPLDPMFGGRVGSRGGSPVSVVAIVVAFVMITGGVLGTLWWRQAERNAKERAAKQREVEMLQLHEALAKRDGPVATTTPLVATAAAGPPTAPPSPAVVQPASTEETGGCPLGSKRNQVGNHEFCIDAYEYPGGHIVPRTNLSYSEAQRLCEARGARLCTRSEWTASCRGPNEASYPWGNTHDAKRCNLSGGTPQEAGSFPRCKAPVGTFDMIGNVGEWVAERVAMGGSALREDPRTRCDYAQRLDPSVGYSDIGLRCCADAK